MYFKYILVQLFFFHQSDFPRDRFSNLGELFISENILFHCVPSDLGRPQT